MSAHSVLGVLQRRRSAQEGLGGFFKGVGRGLLGVAWRPASAMSKPKKSLGNPCLVHTDPTGSQF
jgi:hypothetical protein